MEELTASYVELTERPVGEPGPEHFEVTRRTIRRPGAGEILVENRYLSVDPYMRGRMSDAPSYFPPWRLRAPLDGDAVGVVVESDAAGIEVGDWVTSEEGMRDRFVATAEQVRVLPPPPDGCDRSCYLDVLGATGLTAWLGTRIIRPGPGDTILVSTAAGSVGSVAGQLCKAAGARVIGTTSTEMKARIARERYGFDELILYLQERPDEALARLAPDGLDGFFDNVGGELLEAALDHMRIGGRIAKCGAISSYNATEPTCGPRNLHHFFGKRLTMTGFLVSDHGADRSAFEKEMRTRLDSGEIRTDQRRFHGLTEVPAAFVDLFAGGNVGKTLVVLDGSGDG